MVERHHRTIIERVCVCLHEARLPPSLWCKIAAAIMYLTDFTPGAKHPEITPYELWHNKKPNISHLQPLGCTAYAKIPTEAGGGLSKLDPRSTKGKLIGYFRWDTYRIYDPETCRIYCSHDVIFEEGIGNKTLPPLPSEGGNALVDHVVLDDPVMPNDSPSEDNHPHNKGLTPTQTPAALIPTTTPTTADLPLHRSTCAPIPMQAIRDSWASEQTICDAHTAGEAWACYKFILIFNMCDCQNMFIPSRCLYAALDYVIDARDCGRLDSCHVASCLCNNVHRLEMYTWTLKGQVAQTGRTALEAVSLQ